MDRWLKSKLADQDVKSIYDKFLLNNEYKGRFSSESFTTYYIDDPKKLDKDIENSEPTRKFIKDILKTDPELLTDYDINLLNMMEIYGSDESKIVMLLPGTNQSHASYLFKKLVDYTANTKFEIKPSFKNEFYKFCYNNTYSKYT